MKRVLLCLLVPLALGACNPFPKDEDDSTAPKGRSAAQPKATATPKPTPAPGAWMSEKRENPLDKPAHK